MSDTQRNAVEHQEEEARAYTQTELFELFSQWQQETKQEQQKSFEESELPLDIKQILEETTPHELRENLNRYKKHVQKYYHEDWTQGETTNKEFIQKLKNFNVDTYQVVNTIYEHADLTRITARAATELYEQQLFFQNNHASMGIHQQTQLLEDISEGTKRLAVFSWATAKALDEEARDLTFKAISPPSTLQHLGKKNDMGGKKEVFDQEFIQQYNEAIYHQSVVRAATSSTSNNFRGRGGFQQQRGRGHFRGRGYSNFGKWGRGGTPNYTDNNSRKPNYNHSTSNQSMQFNNGSHPNNPQQ